MAMYHLFVVYGNPGGGGDDYAASYEGRDGLYLLQQEGSDAVKMGATSAHIMTEKGNGKLVKSHEMGSNGEWGEV